jgi:glycogen synthase
VPSAEVGLRFRASDSRSLAGMVERVLSDEELRERLVAEASEHVLRFDWGDIARQTADVYERLLVASSASETSAARRASG